jgi:glycosyltransferase involved in cell wall biosynthesis
MPEKPLVSWLIPTTLYHHRWWNRLSEFLQEDFPAGLIECIFLGTQDENFSAEAKKIAECLADTLSFCKGIEQKWNNVRFVEKYSNDFNIAQSRNFLLQEARGDIVMYRDADTRLVKHGFTKESIKHLMLGGLGILGAPSLRSGFHFKPKSSLITTSHPHLPQILLACSVNGMGTTSLKSILEEMGGWNSVLALWGEHTALCTKLSRAGYSLGYMQDQGYWLATDDEEGTTSLTDDTRNPKAIVEKSFGIGLLNRMYTINPSDRFWDIQQSRYGIVPLAIDDMLELRIAQKFEKFQQEQLLAKDKDIFPFKPWDCLSHRESTRYIQHARSRSEHHFVPLRERIRSLGFLKYLELNDVGNI